MITIAINGVPYQTYENTSIKKSMDKIAGDFSAVLINTQDHPFPFKVDDPCEIQIYSQSCLKGRIETISGSGDASSCNVTVAGRDNFADIIDSTIGGNIEFKAPISLEDMIKQTLSEMGITGFGVTNNVPDIDSFSASDLISAETGKTVFKFLESYARKRQVLLSSDNKSNFVLTRSSTTLQNTPLTNSLLSSTNNIESYNYNYDITKRFNKYILRSQGNPATQDDDAVNFTIMSGTGLSANAVDSDIHGNRIFNKNAEQSTDKAGLAKRAAWEANIRKARSFTYSAVVSGFKNALGNLWDTNVLVQIKDDFAGINSTLLLNSVQFDLTNDGGEKTTLTFVRPDAYTLQQEGEGFQKNKKDKNKNSASMLVLDPRATGK